MSEMFYQQLIEELPTAYAYSIILLDKLGIPYDGEILEVNRSFSSLLNTPKSNLIGKRYTEVIPDIKTDVFNWFDFLGEIALHGGSNEKKVYYEPLKSWYKVVAYSTQKYYFVTYIYDITSEINQLTEMEHLIEITDDLLSGSDVKNNYKKISDDFLMISGAKYAAFNLFDEDGKYFYTKALTGDHEIVKKAVEIIGYKFEDKKWEFSNELNEKIKFNTITRFRSLRDLTGKAINPILAELMEKTFQIGEVILIKVVTKETILGYFMLFMNKGSYFDKDMLAEAFTRQLAMYIVRKHAEEALLREKILFKSIFDSSPGMIYLYDDQNRLIRWNKKHEEITGYSSEELSRMTLFDWYKGDEESQKAVTEGLIKASKEGFGEAEAYLQKKDGTAIPMYFTASIFNIGDKKYFTGIAMDITERKRKEREIFDLSFRDQLTGLYNRRFYEEELKRLDNEKNLPLSIVMGDVNGLKLVNDSFGHVMGDQLLKKVAEVIKKEPGREISSPDWLVTNM